MDAYIFNFRTDLSAVSVAQKLNNPFGMEVPDIARIAAEEFQAYISAEAQDWSHNFDSHKGKMFGTLVVQKEDKTYAYLGTVSGKLLGSESGSKLVPSIFDESQQGYFLTKGMTALTDLSNVIKATGNTLDRMALSEDRKQKSAALQQQLFEHYHFSNLSGDEKNVIEIFEQSAHGYPPAAAGECAAPKLLQYAFHRGLKPIALAEFWWGNPPKSQERTHKAFYPACKNKCRPILEYMLEDSSLFEKAK